MPESHLLAELLAAEGHASRNHVATLRSVAQLLDDDELAAAVRSSTSALQITLERSTTLAQIELGRRPEVVDLELAELLDLAVRRAAREGASVVAPNVLESRVVRIPGTWGERLATDLLHAASPAAGVAVNGSSITATLADDAWAQVDAYLTTLAAACDGELARDAGTVTLTFSSAG